MKKILFIAAASMLGTALYAQDTQPAPAPTADAAAAPADTMAATPPADATATDPAQPATTEAAPPADNSAAATDAAKTGKHKHRPKHGGM